MSVISNNILAGAAGAAGADPLYVDDVFSTHLYEGNSSTRTITNGIDLSGEGGLTWIKCRTISDLHYWYDTERGATKSLHSNGNYSEGTRTNTLTSFNSNGFSLGTDGDTNFNGRDYVSWTFRKAPGFFDVVTYTGDGSSNRSISHSLGSTPGFIIVKRTSSTEDWGCWHNSFSAGERILLNTTAAKGSASGFPAVPTSTTFSVGGTITTNGNGDSYVAYLFAHDDQSFGTNSDEAIIKCGGVTTGSDEYATVNLGFEPQFVMFKRTDVSGDWLMLDTMRGWDLGNDDKRLYANLSNAENTTSSGHGEVNSTGFRIYNLGGSADLIYIAIRRSHKPPTAGTDVFNIDQLSGSQSSPAFRTGIVTDMGWARRPSTPTYYGGAFGVFDRLRGNKYLATSSSSDETSSSFGGDHMNGFYSSAISADIGYSFKRAAGFFDIVAYAGTGSPTSFTHNLDAVPELMIVKKRNYSQNWFVYHSALGNTGRLNLDNNYAAISNSTDWNSTTPTSSVFYVNNNTNDSSGGSSYIAYLFASLDGISKVGSYTGTGNDINVDCGFTAGARLVLVKRTDSGSSNWYLWDTTRGINSGNEPFTRVQTNLTDGSNDFIDPYNLGFTITSSASAQLNASGGNYIFLAIA